MARTFSIPSHAPLMLDTADLVWHARKPLLVFWRQSVGIKAILSEFLDYGTYNS